MPDGHFARLNEREANPNPHFKFISSLPGKNDSEVALEIMRALAAQFKVICKKHGLRCTSFEEHAWNPVFAGRNWNAGEVIELVLRRPGGSFFPVSWLTSVVCHELAHCFHMNHGPGFQKLNALFRAEVKALQARGYYGDGFWSGGTRLLDGTIKDTNVLHDNKADYAGVLCGGAQSRKRPTSSKRRRNVVPLVKGVASSLSGRQTAVPLKPGGRNLKAFEDKPTGNRLDGQRILSVEETKKLRKAEADEKARLAAEKRASGRKKAKLFDQAPKVNMVGQGSEARKVLLGTTGKQARSKSAAAARADAAEKRLQAAKPVKVETVDEDGSATEDEYEQDEPLFYSDGSATESEDEMRARLADSCGKEGTAGVGRKGAWREFVDLTKEDEDDDGTNAPAWVLSDGEIERLVREDAKGKSKERRVSFSSRPIDLDSDSPDEQSDADPEVSKRRTSPSASAFTPRSILRKPITKPSSPPKSPAKHVQTESPTTSSPARPIDPPPASKSASPPSKPQSAFVPTKHILSAPAPPPHLLQPLLSRAFGSPAPASLSIPPSRPIVPPAPPPFFPSQPPTQRAGPSKAVLETQRLIEAQIRSSSTASSSRSPDPPAATEGGTWPCPTCTFANSSLLPACEMCDTVRPVAAAPPPLPKRRRGMFDRPSPPPAPAPPASAPVVHGVETSVSASAAEGGWTCWSCGQGGNDDERWACSRCFEIKRKS